MSKHYATLDLSFSNTTALQDKVCEWSTKFYDHGVLWEHPEYTSIFCDDEMNIINDDDNLIFQHIASKNGRKNSMLVVEGYGLFKYLPTWNKIIRYLETMGINHSQYYPRVVVTKSKRPRRKNHSPAIIVQNLFGGENAKSCWYDDDVSVTPSETLTYDNVHLHVLDYSTTYSVIGTSPDSELHTRAVIVLELNDDFTTVKDKLQDLIIA